MTLFSNLKLPQIAIVVFAFVLPFEIEAAVIACGNVNDDARAHYHANVSASKTTEGKKCTISIGGASASSKTAALSEPLSRCVGGPMLGSVLRNISATNFAAQIIPVLIGASIPDFELTRTISTPRGILRPEECIEWIKRDVVPIEGGQALDSKLHAELKPLAERIGWCLENKASGDDQVRCNQTSTSIVIEFSSSMGRHTVVLPKSQ